VSPVPPPADGDDTTPIDPRIEARRRDVLDDRRRHRRRRWALVVVIAILAAALYGSTRSPLFDVETIRVTGTDHANPDEVRQATGVNRGDHLVDLDLVRAAEGVRALPWIADAQVDNDWAGVVEVRVTERRPAVTVEIPGNQGWLLIDADRRALDRVAAPPADLVVIRGVHAVPIGATVDTLDPSVLAVAAAITPGLRGRVAAVFGSDPAALALLLRPTGLVKLGTAEHVGTKLASLQTVLAQVDLTGLCSIDIRIPDAPVLTRGEGCA
jgi:cell division protein FtsQ